MNNEYISHTDATSCIGIDGVVERTKSSTVNTRGLLRRLVNDATLGGLLTFLFVSLVCSIALLCFSVFLVICFLLSTDDSQIIAWAGSRAVLVNNRRACVAFCNAVQCSIVPV